MARLFLSLLGPFQASLDAQPATGFESNKVRALLAYLAVESDRPHARETLVGLLWPDYPDRSAFGNLRSALANLRHTIGDRQTDPPYLLITRDTIQFNLASDHELDIAELRGLSTQPLAQLAQSLSRYRGPFLEGFFLADSPAFEEWVRGQREQIRLQALDGLHRLAAHYEAGGDYDRATDTARRALALEPWDEEAHRQAMRAMALGGQRSLALAQYETCQQLLRQELDVDPAQETVALAAAIRVESLMPSVALTPEAAAESPAPGEPPFKGLAFFDEADAALFFGRETLIARLVEQVRACLNSDGDGYRILTVIGASGSGKSSLVRAGLIPALRRSDDSNETRPVFDKAIFILTPTARPLEALALTLTRGADGLAQTTALLDSLSADSRSLHLVAARVAQRERVSHVLVVVDQFEELFSLCRDEAERQLFVDNLLYAARTPGPTVVVIALRADFYAQCAPFDNLRQALCQRQEFIGAMSGNELHEVIERPAASGGWGFEPGLVELFLHEVSDAPGALPLLSHALLETWRRRHGRTLTLAGYQATGGVRGAIAHTAETTFKQFSPVQQSLAKNIFLRLTEVTTSAGEEGLTPFYTRRRATLAELTPHPSDDAMTSAVLTKLADARLVIVGQDTAEVAHEALIHEWGRLREWLEENRAGLRVHRHLTEAAQEWEALGEDVGALYRGARLVQAAEWATGHETDLNLQERNFLQASLAAEQAQREAEITRQRRELQAAQSLAEEQRRRAEAEMQRAETQTQTAVKLRRRAVWLALAAAGLVLLLTAAVWLGQMASRNAQARQAQAQLAASRELAAAAVNSLNVDPERSLLLGLQAMAMADTLEARNALHEALPELHGVRTILAHEPGGTPGVAYHPDGMHVASSGTDNWVKVWDVRSGELKQALAGNPGELAFDVAFSPDGKLLAATFSSQTLVWDADSGELRWQLPAEIAGVTQVDRIDFSSDGARLAAANVDGQPKVWDMIDGRELFTLPGHTDHAEAIAFSPDGKRLATGDVAGIVRIWDASTGEELLSFVHGGMVHGVAFSPDGRQLAAAGEDGRLLIWDTNTEQLLLSLPSRSGLYDVTYLPDGKRLATVHQDGTTAIWDAASGQPLLTLAGHISTVISVAASPDNVHIVTSGYDSTVRLWDTGPGRELLTIAAHDGPAYDIAYSPDGSAFATASADGTAALWDPTSGLVDRSLFADTAASGFAGIVFSPDGRQVAAGGIDGKVFVGDADTGVTLLTLPGHTEMVWGLAFSPDGRRLATTSWDRTVRVWEIASGQEIASMSGHTDMVFGVAFSRDGQRLYTAGDVAGREWDANTGEELRTFSGEGLGVFGLALSPDGKRLALGRQDGSVVLWNIASGEKLLQLTGHGGLVLRVVFSQDGTRLATASFDKFAKVWDAQSGQEIATLFGNGGNVFGVDFSPDGQRLVTAGGDGTVRSYTLDVTELKELARSRVRRALTAEECQRYLHVDTCP